MRCEMTWTTIASGYWQVVPFTFWPAGFTGLDEA